MLIIILLVIIPMVIFIIGNILLHLIQKYINKKPLGMQSLLDLLILDFIKIRRVQSTLVVYYYISHVFDIKVSFMCAKILTMLSVNLMCLINASAQVILTVKAILIFKPEWIGDYEEDEIIVLARIGQVIDY